MSKELESSMYYLEVQGMFHQVAYMHGSDTLTNMNTREVKKFEHLRKCNLSMLKKLN